MTAPTAALLPLLLARAASTDTSADLQVTFEPPVMVGNGSDSVHFWVRCFPLSPRPAASLACELGTSLANPPGSAGSSRRPAPR